MFDWIVLGSTFFGSLILSRVLTNRQRNWVVPICVAYTFGLVATVGSVGGFLHFIFTVWNFVIVMILTNGLKSVDGKDNPAWRAFLFFYGYMCLIVFTGYFPVEGIRDYLQSFLNTFASGYCLAIWMCGGEGRYGKVLSWVIVSAWFVIFYSAMHGGFSAANLDAHGRGALDVELLAEGVKQNVNYVALTCACFLPFLLSAMLKGGTSTTRRILQISAGGAFVMITLMMIRTGARNGALALLPCIWYFLAAAGSRRKKVGRIMIGVVVLLSLCVGVSYMMKNAESLRAFNFSSKGQEGYETKADALTSGRFSMYIDNYNSLTPLERIIGKGFTLTNSRYTMDKETGLVVAKRKITSGNAHSMYLAIFYRSGFVGLLFFFAFIVVCYKQGRRLGSRGKLGLLYLGVWLMTGVGEAWGMTGGHTAILAGIAMGLFTNKRIINTELGGSGLPQIWGVEYPNYSW